MSYWGEQYMVAPIGLRQNIIQMLSLDHVFIFVLMTILYKLF